MSVTVQDPVEKRTKNWLSLTKKWRTGPDRLPVRLR